MKGRVYGLLAIGMYCTLVSASAFAAGDPADGCEASKLGASGKYAQCRLKVDSKAVKKGVPADYTKCNLDKFASAEAKAGTGVCPSEGDQASIEDFLEACTTSVAVALDGGTLPLDVVTCNAELASCQAVTCGNGTAEYGESCDGAALQGKTCATETPSTPYGALACNGTCDGFDTSSCKPRFTDNGDGTITDNSTHLMWEKKTGTIDSSPDYSNPHEVDNYYPWTAGTTAPDGPAFMDFLEKLNGQAGAGTGFAGHYDWRLPTREELQGILDLSAPGCGLGMPGPDCPDPSAGCQSPCIDAVFGATRSDDYWSFSTFPSDPTAAWSVFFFNGNSGASVKTENYYARAVRAGS